MSRTRTQVAIIGGGAVGLHLSRYTLIPDLVAALRAP